MEVFTVHEQLDLRGRVAHTSCCVLKHQGASEASTCSQPTETKPSSLSRTLVQSAIVLFVLMLASPFAWEASRMNSPDLGSAGAPGPAVAQNRLQKPALPADLDLAAVLAAT